MREAKQLLEFVRSVDADEFILASIIATEGSSYRKAGARKVIALDGSSAGLLSGGCLEGEIINRALRVSPPREEHVFDTMDEVDRLFGYATGCQGKITVAFERLSKDELYQGSYLGISPADKLEIRVVGAGPDLDPLHELLQWTGWDYHFFTPKTDLLKDRMAQGWLIQKLDNQKLKSSINLPERSVVLLMSHNYPTDLDVLSSLADQKYGYIGILGPKERREKMMEDLHKVYRQDISPEFSKRVFGPIGSVNLGRGEVAVAMAIVSELQARFFGERG